MIPLISLQELKQKYKKLIADETEKNKFLLNIYKQLLQFQHKPKITRRELNKIFTNQNEYYYIKGYTGMYLIINYKDTEIKIHEYDRSTYKQEEETQTQKLLNGLILTLTLDYIEKYKLELNNLTHIYNKYKKAIDLLNSIESPIPNLDDVLTIRKSDPHHIRHSYFLKEHLTLLAYNPDLK